MKLFSQNSNLYDNDTSTSQTDGQTDWRTDNSWARMHGAQLSAGYTVNTYSKPPLYDASKGTDVWFSQRAAKPDVIQQAALFHWPLADDVDIYL